MNILKMPSTTLSILLAFVFVVLVLWVFLSSRAFDAEPKVVTSEPAPLYLDEAQPIEARVADLLSYMTLEEKIGQMTLVEKNSLEREADIATYKLGALLSGAGSKPLANTVSGWRDMIAGYQNVAASSRLGIPLLYGVDAVHGHGHLEGATVFPHALSLGATGDAELVEKIARATALELAATGVNWSFSPNLDQPRDIRWGRVYEGFSDDPALVSKLGVAYLQGLQVLEEREGGVFVLGTLKHYLGLGGMGWNTSLNPNFKIDQGVTPANKELLRLEYLPPFQAAVEAGALSVMAGLNTWGDKRMVLQKELLTDLLKNELQFKGFIVSDWYGVHEGRKNIFWATVQAINAGIDMVMLPFDYKTFQRHMLWGNRLGLISDERIDDAVGRILYTKFALGLFDNKLAEFEHEVVGNEAHRKLATDAVSQSLVLLKNEGVLPLAPTTSYIKVAGSAADNIGQQMGAWSIEWQGIEGNDVRGATSILTGIKNVVSPATRVEYDRFGNFRNNAPLADVGIAIVGEKPYAEGWGDTAYPILSSEDLAAIKNLQATSKKVVVVVVSGRPLLITEEVESFDGLVAAWLPGSEGAGVAEVLFGQKPFTGTLPLPWPARTEQLPLGSAGETADGTPLLFPRAFGLRY